MPKTKPINLLTAKTKLLKEIKSFLNDYEAMDEMSTADNVNFLIDAVEILNDVKDYLKANQ